MSTDKNDDLGKASTVLDTIQKFLLPFILVICGWMYTEIKTLEQRQYEFKGDIVSKTELKVELKDLENRLMYTINDKMSTIERDVMFIKNHIIEQRSKE